MKIIETTSMTKDFCHLRQVACLSPRPYDAVVRVFPASLYGVHIVVDDETVGISRVVGDGAIKFEVVDIVVDPRYQSKGHDRVIIESIMAYLTQAALTGSYVCLMAEVLELYEKFGFQLTRLHSEGVFIWWA